jgi:hypothetical protein
MDGNRFQELWRRSNLLLPTTSPIYVKASDRAVESIGTGIFFRHEGRDFVLSAAHVLKHLEDRPLLIGSDALITLDGEFFTSTSADHDLGVFPLSNAQSTALRGAVFITSAEIARSDDSTTETEGSAYYFVGFRAFDNQPEGTPSDVTSIGSAYLAHAASADKYMPLGLSPTSHLVLRFDREKLYSDAITVESEPEPEGLSGSGVWKFAPSAASDKLVAILIEHTDNHKGIIGTRLGRVLDALTDYMSGRSGRSR